MKTILIVDDLESVRFYHQQLLKHAGYQTLTAGDGIEALAQLERNSVDLVMLDLLMPRMNGADFLRRARALDRYDGLPVLVISSEAPAESALEPFAAGVCEFMQKPIPPSSLLAAMRRMLG